MTSAFQAAATRRASSALTCRLPSATSAASPSPRAFEFRPAPKASMLRPRLAALKHPLLLPPSRHPPPSLLQSRPPIRQKSTLPPPIPIPPPASLPPVVPNGNITEPTSTAVSSAPSPNDSSTIAPSQPTVSPPSPPSNPSRSTASFYISNVLPIRLAYWDFRPTFASLREEALMEALHDIASEMTGDPHDFQVESWEIARKDGGVFLHFSYIAPPITEDSTDDSTGSSSLPELVAPGSDSPGKLFLTKFVEGARKHGGFPSWLGQWRPGGAAGGAAGVPGHTIYDALGGRMGTRGEAREKTEHVGGAVVKDSGSGLRGLQAAAGAGRVWVVKGKQWTEDMNRFPSNRLRIEFEGPDVSQEVLYTLFRPYGRVADIVPPSPVPAGSLRFASVVYSQISPAATATNCLHGYSTPTNTGDFTLRRNGSDTNKDVVLSRLRIYYERPLKAHAIRDWVSGHPRIALPIIAFLVGTLSYTFFDPIRAFFVRSKLEGTWDLDNYPVIKYMRQIFHFLPSSFGFRSSPSVPGSSEISIGQDAWADRVQAEKDLERWLSEYPSTFITITGPPGSGKVSLVSRVLERQQQPVLIIDCAEIGKSKTDATLIDALADQTGYYPVFSFLSSLNGMIDLASVGLIGQKAGFSTPIDQQLRSLLETVGGALKDVSTRKREEHRKEKSRQQDRVRIQAEKSHRQELIARGGWHDGRLDCVAGNGPISELGLGEEPTYDSDLTAPPPPLIDDIAPIHGEAVPPTAGSLAIVEVSITKPVAPTDLEDESESINSLPIIVLKNFALKSARGDLWNVLSEWGASLIENKIAYVIVITEGATANKALTKALPTKPLNSVGLADAAEDVALYYVQEKLGSTSTGTLSTVDRQQVAKLGGRMVDLETFVYKVRTGSSVQDAINDIVLRNVIELRKQAFGDDAEDAKALPWTRAQAWKVVSQLAKDGELSYARLLQEFPFKGAEASLKAMEEHELVSVTYFEGRASRVRPGKPVFRFAFEALCNDPVFRASCQMEYNAVIISTAETTIKSCENELSQLKDITTNGGDTALGVNHGGLLGFGQSSAVKERARWLLEKMGKSVDQLGNLERENAEMLKVLGSGRA